MASEAATLRYPYPIEDPDTLRAQRRTLVNLGQMLLDTHAEVNDDKLALADSWQSDAATTAVADVTELSGLMKGDSTSLADGGDAITTYLGHVGDARDDIDGIRKRYDEAIDARNDANADMPDAVDTRWEREEQRRINQSALDEAAGDLDDEYDTVLETLRDRSKTPVAELEAVLTRFVGEHPPTSQTLGEVAYERASENLDLTGGRYEFRLRQEGLLEGASPDPDSYYAQWLENAERQGVDPEVLVEIARDHDITPESFALLEDLEEIKDPDGKSYFLLPDDISGDDAERAVILTYIFNAGTDYGEGHDPDFTPEPYSSAEVQRILDRQEANDWTYDDDVDFVHDNGGRLVTTPNGMMMGLGGNWLQDLYSQKGGTAWGDIFVLNIDDPDDAADQLRDTIRSGNAWYTDDDGNPYEGSLDLDQLLHHEERHSQQWADKGYTRMLFEAIFNSDGIEEDAGLGDGGYH